MLMTPTAFHRGSGVGFYGALGAEYRPDPIWGGMLYVGYDDRRGSFDDVITPCDCPASLSTTISYISIEPSLRVAPFSSGFYLFAGPRIGFNITKSFNYREQSNPVFEAEGDMSDIRSTVFSGQIGAGYDISLTSPEAHTQVSLSPFVSFQPYFGQDPRSVETWNVTTLRAGAELKFGRGKDRARVSAPLATEREVLFSVRAPKIVPVQRRVRETFPLRNYVVFDDGSTEVPSRYEMLTKDQATSFQEDQLQEVQPKNMIGRSGRQMTVYYNILNILGDRMRKSPGAVVTLTGASGIGPEDGKALAESIKQYLVSVFGIDGSRITTEGREKPRIPSELPGGARELPLLRAEDRRVDIESNSSELLMQVGGPPDVLKPVQIVAIQENPLDGHVIFKVVGARELFSTWSLEVRSDGGLVRNFGPFTREQESIPGNVILGNSAEGDFKVTMLGQTKSGHSVKKEGSVHLVRRVEPKPEGLRFSILFEFDRSKTIATYENFLAEMVAPLIPDGGVVIIHGYTDVIGEEYYNQTLSNERAQEAKSVIERTLAQAGKSRVTFDSFGFGEDPGFAPFDNNLPEERFYNRTVIIDIVPGE